ncbi:hypothetical protein GIB67_020128, partial [Kingdonia uniflora]
SFYHGSPNFYTLTEIENPNKLKISRRYLNFAHHRGTNLALTPIIESQAAEAELQLDLVSNKQTTI